MRIIAIKKRDGTQILLLVSPHDFADACQISWCMAGGKGKVGKYAHNSQHGYLHRWVAMRMGLLNDAVPNAAEIDHINGDKLDNRRENLRLLRRPENMRNSNDKLRSTNRSGYRGVSFVARRERYGKPWMAYVTVDYKTKNLGWYATAEEAAQARRRWDEVHAEG